MHDRQPAARRLRRPRHTVFCLAALLHLAHSASVAAASRAIGPPPSLSASTPPRPRSTGRSTPPSTPSTAPSSSRAAQFTSIPPPATPPASSSSTPPAARAATPPATSACTPPSSKARKYPTITFRPTHVDGKIDLTVAGPVTVHGILNLHGQDHPLQITVNLHPQGPTPCALDDPLHRALRRLGTQGPQHLRLPHRQASRPRHRRHRPLHPIEMSAGGARSRLGASLSRLQLD